MAFYINIHSHRKAIGREWVLVNLYPEFALPEPGNFYSAGIHPWDIHEENANLQLHLLEEIATSPHIKAIGECGLDRLCNTPMLLQKNLFCAQLRIACKQQKPLIIHCVRAYDDVLQVLERTPVNIPVLFHGFSGSTQRALQLTRKGYYLSFGKSLRQTRVQQLLPLLPREQWLLETDDAAIPIESLYEIAAKSLNIPGEVLSLQIQKNATSFLGFAPTTI